MIFFKKKPKEAPPKKKAPEKAKAEAPAKVKPASPARLLTAEGWKRMMMQKSSGKK